MFRVAVEVGRLPEEIAEVYSEEEVLRWGAFFRIRNEREQEAIEAARREAGN